MSYVSVVHALCVYTGCSWLTCPRCGTDQILINRKSYSRIEDVVQAEPLGDLVLKGIAQPVPVLNITGVKV